jgi:hypothetical protein
MQLIKFVMHFFDDSPFQKKKKESATNKSIDPN